MKKVIFIDDEHATLKLLSKVIDWKKEGYSIEGTATDGEEGLELYKRAKPDLIIVDVIMPVMDGIEFIRRIREIDKKVIILVLSAYSEFEYAQKAISYDISDYLLKPLDENKLLEALGKVNERIENQRYEMENYNRLKARLDYYLYMPMLKEIADTVFRGTLPESYPEGLEEIVRRPCFNSFFSVYLKTMRSKKPLNDSDIGKNVADILRECMSSAYPEMECIFITVNPSATVMICGTGCLDRCNALHKDYVSFIEKLEKAFEENNIFYKAGLSKELKGLSGIPDSFMQAFDAFCVSFYSDAFRVSYYEEKDIPLELEEKYLAEHEDIIEKSILSGNSVEILEFINKSFLKFRIGNTIPDSVYDFCFNLLLIVKMKLTNTYSGFSFNLLRHINHETIENLYSCNALENFMQEVITSTFCEIKSIINSDKNFLAVSKAKEYGYKNFMKYDFSIQHVSDFTGLSKNHFSKIYKEVTGENYWDFISRIRIAEAKKLLKSTNKTNFEISKMIGYESEFHFSRKFKEITGMTPVQYRKL